MIKMFNSLTFLLKEALVRFLRQLSLELLYRLQRNTDDDDDSGSADTHGARQIRKQRNGMRQHRDERQADGAEHGDAAQHLVDIFLRLVARRMPGIYVPDFPRFSAILAGSICIFV